MKPKEEITWTKSDRWKITAIILSIVSASLVVLLIVVLLLTVDFRFFQNSSPVPANNNQLLTAVPLSPSPTPNKNTSNKNAIVQILHPLPQPITVTSNQKPTIIGRISNLYEPITGTILSSEDPSHAQYDYYEQDDLYLHFVPGQLLNVRAELSDDTYKTSIRIGDVAVYGISETPIIPCDRENNPAGGEKSAIPFEYVKKQCLQNWNQPLPPVLFFYKPDRALPAGRYNLTITLDGYVNYYFDFVVNPDYVPDTNPFNGIRESEKKLYGDYCASQIWQVSEIIEGKSYNFLEIPMPLINSRQLGYPVLFPQTVEEAGKGSADRMVYIKFDDTLYDLILPGAPLYYRRNAGELASWYNRKLSQYDLHLPISLLYFKNGSRAIPAELPDHTGMIYPDDYLELLPADAGGRTYPEETLQHFTTSSSSCDG